MKKREWTIMRPAGGLRARATLLFFDEIREDDDCFTIFLDDRCIATLPKKYNAITNMDDLEEKIMHSKIKVLYLVSVDDPKIMGR